MSVYIIAEIGINANGHRLDAIQLMEMAAREEIKEAERWAEIEADPLLASIPDRKALSPQILELQHKIREAEREKKKTVTDSGEVEPQRAIYEKFKKITEVI